MDAAFFRRLPGTVLLALPLFLVFSASASEPTVDRTHKPICAFEFLTFRSSAPDRTFLEVFGQVPTDNLQFIKYKDGFCASYRLNVSLEDGRGELVYGEDFVDSVRVQSFWEIDKPRPPKLVRFAFLVPPGSYLANVSLQDLETLRVVRFKRPIMVPDYRSEALSLSDLQLAVSITPTDRRNVLVKNGRLILPNIARLVSDKLAELHVYTEVYNLLPSTENGKEEFEATYSILDGDDRLVESYVLRNRKPGSGSYLTVALPVADLPSGQYQLVLTVKDLSTQKQATKATHFLVLKPGLDSKFYTDLIARAHGESVRF